MTLVDTGPLVALINKNDPNHLKSVDASKELPSGSLITTWPCFTEAMYLLFRAGGHPAQAELWRWQTARRLVLHHSTDIEIVRMAELMATYHDRPMDLADASLVAAAEHFNTKRLFTLDSDFYVYRLIDGYVLECVP